MRKLSIIIPIYNVEPYLRSCLDSAILPGRTDYEIIAVDDGSPDGCPAIADDYARRYPELIRVIHQPNGGLGAARNTGLAAARGEYVLFLDSDDALAPGALPEMLDVLAEGADVFVFDFLTVDEQGRVLSQSAGAPVEGSFTLAEHPELLLSPPNAWNKLWRRSLFEASGIRYPARLWYEDLATSPGLYLQAKRLFGVHRPWIRYLLRGGSITNSKNIARNTEIITAVDLAAESFRKAGQFDRYAPALEAMAVAHQLLAATVRVNSIDPRSPLQRELLADLDGKFPHWRQNPYLPGFSARRRLLLRLLDRRRYGAVHGLMRLNNILKGKKL